MHIVHLHLNGARRATEKTATTHKVAMDMADRHLRQSSAPVYYARVWWDADRTPEKWELFRATDRQVHEDPRRLGD
jgi:hypothetical protein